MPWQARANWKAMLENYLECYHCAVAHPGFSAAIDVEPLETVRASVVVGPPGSAGHASTVA